MILAIYGSGGLGREIFDLAMQINYKKQKYSEILFVDDQRKAGILNGIRYYPFSEMKQTFNTQEIEFCIAVGEPLLRAEFANRIKRENWKKATLIAPTSVVADSVQIADGCIICNFAVVLSNVVLKENVLLQSAVTLTHDDVVCENSILCPHVSVGGGTSIGRNTFIGIGANIRDHIRVGNNVVVSMGASILYDVEDYAVMKGNPASYIHYNDGKYIFSSKNEK